MDAETRRQLEDVTRNGLAKIGATPAQLAHVLEPGISDEELVRRSREVIDACIATRLAGIGMNGHEVHAAMDTSGTPAEQEARRRGALEGAFARSLERPEVLDAVLEQALRDPAIVAEMEALARAEERKRARRRGNLIVLGVVALGIAAFASWKVLHKAPCAKLLGPDAELARIFGAGTHVGKAYDSKFSCQVAIENDKGLYVAHVELEPANRWAGYAREAAGAGYASVEPVRLGEEAKLAIPPAERKDVDLMAAARAARARGSRDPMGDALSAAGPSGPLLVARGPKSALRISVSGTAEQARALATQIAQHEAALHDASY